MSIWKIKDLEKSAHYDGSDLRCLCGRFAEFRNDFGKVHTMELKQ